MNEVEDIKAFKGRNEEYEYFMTLSDLSGFVVKYGIGKVLSDLIDSAEARLHVEGEHVS